MIGVIATLLGGIGLFLLGMSMLTDGLKVAAGPALRTLLERWTGSALRGLLAGMLITAIVQSSSAVTVATIGFVNAGLLSLSQAVWVMFGANVGTTMTAWLVALVGVRLDVGTLALPLLGLGMIGTLVSGRRARLAGMGRALAGFGAFFLGIAVLQQGFAGIADSVPRFDEADHGVLTILGFVLAGSIITLLTQSSSVAIAIVLTAVSAGTLALLPAAAVVIGANIGTTSTAALAAIGATPAARRVAVAHVVFNLLAGAAALLLLYPMLASSLWIANRLAESPLPATVLAVFHTLFNILGLLLILPIAPWLIRRLSGLFRAPGETMGKARFLDAPLSQVPAVAIRGLVLEISHMAALVFEPARARVAGDAATDGTAARDAALMLGKTIRAFIARVGKRPLDRRSVAALADLIRATQHLEDAAVAAALLDPARRADGAMAERWADLVRAALPALESRVAGAGSAEELEAMLHEVGQAYEAIKAALLTEAASGRIGPEQMDAALLEAAGIRDTAEAAIKAQRRALPWASRGISPA
ncbi:MAG: Na/Pi cotransporter family protein [Sandarakinorhabdus sp.]|nr:Na/Pi cotransporter family protein [Sandarakinorhabdus sp.]